MIKKILFILFILLYFYPVSSQDFNYLSCLRTYWNYRYHTVGDAINRNQHMPFDGNFLSPDGIGESGMLVVGVDAGNSLLTEGIFTVVPSVLFQITRNL